MKLAVRCLLAGSALIACAATAQEGNPDPMSGPVAARFGTLPESVAGLPRADGGYSAPLAAYGRGDGIEPIIAVFVNAVAEPTDRVAMTKLGRAGAGQAGILKMLFEGKFNVVGQPEAKTYFGDFLTDQGVKQSWIAEYGGVRVTILATIYRSEDRRRVFDAIRNDLLGGAVMSAPIATIGRK